MAKKKELPQTVALNIPTEQIFLSPTNPRRIIDAEGIHDLAASIKSVGLIQPITVREKAHECYEIVAGERRFRAMKELNWTEIPCIIRDISDEEVLEIQIIENLQRQDVDPIDEASAFQTLIAKQDIAWLSARIHKSKKYIQDRVKLLNLLDEAKKLLQEGVLPLGHAICISKLPDTGDQKKALGACTYDDYSGDSDEPRVLCSKTLDDLRNFIDREIMLDFDKVPFDVNDETLVEAAGSCANCPKRTCNNSLLFSDLTSDDKCTDPICFNRKIQMHVHNSKQAAKEKYEDVKFGRQSMYGSSTVIFDGHELQYQTKFKKGLTPVVITQVKGSYDRKNLGKTVFVDMSGVKETPETDNGIAESSWYEHQLQAFKDEHWPKIMLTAEICSGNAAAIPKEIWSQFWRLTLHQLNNRAIIGIHSLIVLKNKEVDLDNLLNQEENIENAQLIAMVDEILGSIVDAKALALLVLMLRRFDDEEDLDQDDDDLKDDWKWIMTVLKNHPSVNLKKARKK